MSAKKLLYLMMIGMIGSSSCKKDVIVVDVFVPRLSTEKQVFVNEVLYSNTYQYDGKGRLIRQNMLNGFYAVFEYDGSTVTVKGHNGADSLWYTFIYTLNSKGLATSLSVTQYKKKSAGHYSNKNTADSTHYTWGATREYDDNGYLIKEIVSNGFIDTTYYTIVNGNTISSATHSNGKIYPVSYQFLPNTTNTIGNENKGIFYLGKGNKNLYQSDSYSNTFSYTFDDNNRVIKKQTGRPDNPNIITYSYIN